MSLLETFLVRMLTLRQCFTYAVCIQPMVFTDQTSMFWKGHSLHVTTKSKYLIDQSSALSRLSGKKFSQLYFRGTINEPLYCTPSPQSDFKTCVVLRERERSGHGSPKFTLTRVYIGFSPLGALARAWDWGGGIPGTPRRRWAARRGLGGSPG